MKTASSRHVGTGFHAPLPPIYRRLSVVNSPNSPISGRNPGGELTAPIKRRNTAVFRRQPRSRVQDARGFFLVGIVFGFLLWLWVWMFSVCCWIACSFVLLLVVDGFFFCVFSFWLAFRFALFLVRISVLIAFPVCSVSVPEHGMQKAPRHSGADCFPNRFAATGVTGAISIRWPAQNHLRYRTVAWKTIHSPGGSIWSIWFGTGLAVRRRISSLGPISGPNDPIWSVSDIGFDGWKFPISEP